MTKMKKKYQDLLKSYQNKLEQINASTDIDVDEGIATRKKRIKHLLSDYKAFSKYYFPHYCKADAADFHIRLAETLSKNKTGFFIRMWARSLAKSTNSTIMIPIWLMLRGEVNFVVLVSNTQDSAVGLLSDLQAELEANNRLIHDFGNFQNLGSWEMGDFTTRQKVRFKALGRRQSPRGLRNREHRPDLILLDDIDDDLLIKNPKLVKDSVKWVLSALFGAFSAKGGRFLAVGNLIGKDSIMSALCKVTGADIEQVNLLDEDGEPTWDYYTREECNRMIDTMGYLMSQREYFNNPITEGTVYKEDYFQYKKRLPFKDYDSIVCYTDPSFTSHNKSDFKATVLIGKWRHEYHLLKCFVEQTSVQTMVDWHYQIMDFVNGEGNVFYYMEANFIQYQILDNFDQEAKVRGLAVPIQADKRKKPNKIGRIEAMSPYFEKGYFYISIKEKDCPHVANLIGQFTSFEKGSRAPDDAPDATEGAIFLLNNKTRSDDQPIVINRTTKSKYRH